MHVFGPSKVFGFHSNVQVEQFHGTEVERPSFLGKLWLSLSLRYLDFLQEMNSLDNLLPPTGKMIVHNLTQVFVI